MKFFKRNWLFITVVSAFGFFAGLAAAPTTEIPADSAVEPAPADSSAATPAPDATAPAATPAVATPTVTAAPAEDQVRDIAHFAEAAAASAVTVRKAVTDLSQRVTALEEKSASTPAPVAPTATAPVAPEERYEEARIRAKWRGYPRSAEVSYFNLRSEGRTFNVRADDPENFRAWLAREESEFQAWLKGTKP